jgi:hypothetical protein
VAGERHQLERPPLAQTAIAFVAMSCNRSLLLLKLW